MYCSQKEQRYFPPDSIYRLFPVMDMRGVFREVEADSFYIFQALEGWWEYAFQIGFR
jgi:hypothetical protein